MSRVNNLDIYAGPEALAHIQQNGLQANDIKVVLGASSGPKWLVLHGIDQFLIDDFLNANEGSVDFLGTSAGAWRMASLTHTHAKQAHQRLTQAYIEQRYSAKPSAQEILSGCRQVIADFLGEDGAVPVFANARRRLNVIATQCHGLPAQQHKALKTAGFALAALANRLSRKSLAWQFSRILMRHPQSELFSRHLSDLPTRYSELGTSQLVDTLLATGSIPIIIEGIRDLAGTGVYQDGGITDYAFDLPLLPKQGFVLFPHFAKIPAPGWFDKGWINQYRPWRVPSKQHYARTIMLVPSDDYVKSLPGAKIPDRHDFLNLDDVQRIKAWREVEKRGEELKNSLATMDWAARVKPLPW